MENDRSNRSAEEKQPLVKLRYRLTEQDYYTCLKTGRTFLHSGTRAWIETAILTVIGAGYLFSYLFEKQESMSLVLAIICAAIIAVIWIMPERSMRAAAKEHATNRLFIATVWPDRLEIGEGSGQWCIAMDGRAHYWETDTLLVIEDAERQMTAFPKKDMSAGELALVKQVLHNGAVNGTPKRRRR